MTLLEQIDGSLLTITSQDTDTVYCWFGGTTINIYNSAGAEVDCFSASDDLGRPLSRIEYRNLINDRMSNSLSND